MTKVWIPTNIVWILNRILVYGPSDVPNVHAIQDAVKVMPLSNYLKNSTSANSDSGTTMATNDSSTTQPPINPAPQFIPATGIKIFDDIGKAMRGNPLYPADPTLVQKLASIGIGPGMAPSVGSNNTIREALESAIPRAEKLIDGKVQNAGQSVNGWSINFGTGVYGTDYLFRAAVAKHGFGANIAQEAVYPITFTDVKGQSLTGSKNYTIHFEPGQTPPVNAFWSVTMYDNKTLFVDNPINRYAVGSYTEGLKNNTDGSLDIYIQNTNPGPERESNWLPAPAEGESFSLMMRAYLPSEAILNGTWSPPPVIQSAG
jgi:hypothetical protein